MPNGANEFTVEELEKLFNDDIQQETPPANEETASQESVTTETKSVEVDQTKAFAHRLKESTEKARMEERENIAKSLGYESYDDMTKKREEKLMQERGFDPDQVSPLVEQLVKQRLDSDPRMKELAEFRENQVKEFGKRELAEITKLTNGEITEFSQLSKEVIDRWKDKGSLKSAYLELEGEKLINKIRSEQSKGSTSHLVNPSGSSDKADYRPLTDAEKKAWRVFQPGITEEELNKKTKKI